MVPAWMRQEVLLATIVCVASSVLSVFVSRAGWFQDVEARFFDTMNRARDQSEFGRDVVLVALDDDVYATFDRLNPTPRDYLAKIIDKLVEAKVAVIGLDFIFDLPAQGNDEDLVLEDALRRARQKGVVVVIAAGVVGMGLEPPLERFSAHAIIGHVGIESTRTRAALASAPIESFARRLARAAGAERRPSSEILFPPDPPLRIVPASDLSLVIETYPEMFSGKIAVVGSTAKHSGDRISVNTSVPGFEEAMPGLLIQGYALATLATSIPKRSPLAIEMLATFALSALVLAGCLVLESRFWPLLAISFMAIISFGVVYLAASLDYFMNPVPAILSSGLVALAWRYQHNRRTEGVFAATLSRPVLRSIRKDRAISDLMQARRCQGVFLVCDLIGYSKACRDQPPDVALEIANDYLAPAAEIIEQKGGMVDRYTGDGLLAYFGPPVPWVAKDDLAAAAEAAVEAAIRIRDSTRLASERRATQGEPKLDISFGIETGTVLAGFIGSRRRLQYTVMGEAVNNATRIENVGHLPDGGVAFTSRILISSQLRDLLGTRYCWIERSIPRESRVVGEVFELRAGD